MLLLLAADGGAGVRQRGAALRLQLRHHGREELSRWLFVWMTFLGADRRRCKEHGHLGTDMLVARLGRAGKKVCLVDRPCC